MRPNLRNTAFPLSMNRQNSARSWSAAAPCRFGRPTACESGRGLPLTRHRRFMVPMHGHGPWRLPMDPRRPLTPSLSPSEGETGVWTFSAGLTRPDDVDPGVSGTDLPPGPQALGRCADGLARLNRAASRL